MLRSNRSALAPCSRPGSFLRTACKPGPRRSTPPSRPGLMTHGERAIAPDESFLGAVPGGAGSRPFSDHEAPSMRPSCARLHGSGRRLPAREGAYPLDLRAFVGRNPEESGSVETAPPPARDLASQSATCGRRWTFATTAGAGPLLPAAAAETLRGRARADASARCTTGTPTHHAFGLTESGQHQRVRDMLDNFAYLIDTYGQHSHRNPQLLPGSRSQPPFFAYMVDLQARREATPPTGATRRSYRRNTPSHWMEGSAGLRPQRGALHVVGNWPTEACMNSAYWGQP
ncbi:trehalase family glycosidase [Pseudomonas aeruginosa]